MNTSTKRTKRSTRDILLPLIYISVILGLSLFLGSCSDVCTDQRVMDYYEPIYMSLDDLRSSVQTVTTEREIENPGKIYYLNGYVLINQPNEGFHVIDNKDKANPEYVSFVEIPGNFDIAGSGNYVFADSYIDLIVLDFTNKTDIKEVKRVKNIFPNYNNMGFGLDENLGIVTGWEHIEKVEDFSTDCNGGFYQTGGWGLWRGGIVMETTMVFDAAASAAPGGSPGIGGSLARFTVTGNHLYTVDDQNLTTVDVSDPMQPIIGSRTNIGWGLETIFPYNDLLFLGANNGMHIMDISNPNSPNLLSTYSHIFSCDPVVVQGDYAYVTLRSGTNCRRGQNVLEVVDISSPASPQMVSSFDLFNPSGLGIDGDNLFICDGAAGLKIFDASDKMNITSNMIKAYPDLIAIDVIPYQNNLMVIAEDGFYQYDYSNIGAIDLQSKIDITRTNN